MFDEWYAQSPFEDSPHQSNHTNVSSKAVHTRNSTIDASHHETKRNGSAAIPEFEKPNIIRPKSEENLQLLQKKLIQRQDLKTPSTDTLHLRVEQDLAAKQTKSRFEDDIHYEQWVDNMQNEIEAAELKKYLTFRAVLEAKLHSCNSILSETSKLLDVLGDLKAGFNSVSTQTASFQTQCDSLVKEEEHLSRYADKLAENLQPFEHLEPISRQLNIPGADLVTRPDFIQSLKRMDEGSAYFKTNADFKDAELYEMRFRQCMTRALTLVRVYFVNSLKSIANDINQRISAKALNETTQSALLYAKFRSGAEPLKKIIKEIEGRSYNHDEYTSLLNECYQAYFAIRLRLISPIIMKRMAEISGNKDIICRSAFSFLRSVCVDEYELFYQFFTTGEKELYQYLSALSEPLYDHVRPRIIHETQIITLSELCLLLQTQFMRDPDEVDTNFFATPTLDFGILVQPALQDAQSRLVFRTENLIVNEIQNFVPKDRDLEYPRLLHVTSGSHQVSSPITSPTTPDPADASKELFDSELLFQGWYPTLRKSIWILSKIYHLVHSAVFDSLAHQIVHLCILSLFHASTLLSNRSTQLDADLFLIKHLLILKEQIGAFDIEYVRPETEIDFSRVMDRFRSLSTAGFLSPSTLRSVVQLPVVENLLDAKDELDGKLRVAINGFTKETSESVVAMINGKAGVEKKEDEIREAATKFREVAENVLVNVQQKTQEYICDARTTDILVSAVLENVLGGYDEFYAQVEENHGKLAGEIWDGLTMASWLNGLIQPKNGEAHDDDDDVASNAGSEGRLERDFDDG